MIHLAYTALQVSQGPAPDTLAVVAAPSFLATAEAVSTIVLALVMVAVLVALVVVLLQVRKLSRSLMEVVRKVEQDSGPVLDKAKNVAENVDFISAAIRSDVEKLSESVSGLSKHLRESAQRMEERIQDFNALVDVLQTEAETLALDTAATVRGVKEGTRSLAARGNGPPSDEGTESEG